jgi:hypothetical protein
MLLHENSRPYMADLTKATLVTVLWEIMTRPPYSADLGPSGFHFWTNNDTPMITEVSN